jgi:GNAT superfamily N-acetyltransferase
MSWQVQPLSKVTLEAYLDLFDNRAFANTPQWSGCYCQYYLAPAGTAASSPDQAPMNREQACSRLEAGTFSGYLAFDGEKAIGWCAAGPANQYQLLPPETEGKARIPCFVIDPAYRGKGVATALLKFAIDDLRARGFATIQAAPAAESTDQEGNYHGPKAMYLKAGFVEGPMMPNGQQIVELEL